MSLTHCNLSNSKKLRQARKQQRALWYTFALTSSFMVVEFIGGLLTNSLALMADAGHMLTDAAALALSTFALWFSSRPATEDKTYGFYRVEILSALINGIALGTISLIIFYHAYHRLFNPPQIQIKLMLSIATVGLFVNFGGAWLLHRVHDSNLNIQGAFLHILGDAVSSIGAILAGILMWIGNWFWADPLASLLVGLLILYNSWGLVRDSVDILLEGTPSHINLESVKSDLSEVPGVNSIHDLHIWTLTSGLHALSCHAVVDENNNNHNILKDLISTIQEKYHIEHATIQLEISCPHSSDNLKS
jgi:cobalt-zinc-cadmium efflux system protein